MQKDEYLQLAPVRSFTKWFASDEAQKLSHNYFNLAKKSKVSFKDLPDAFVKYEWHGNLDKNAKILDTIRIELRSAIQSHNFEQFQKGALELMKWGGTGRGNNEWLSHKANFEVIYNTIQLLESGSDDLAEIGKVKSLRFNSGLTKVYSLLIDNFIIYDSRVAAALSWYVVKFSESSGESIIPKELKFACMKAKGGKQTRNPSNKSYDFEYTKLYKPEIHAMWNIRSSWILKAALDLMGNSKYQSNPNVDPLRALEAALFMWGYDLNTVD